MKEKIEENEYNKTLEEFSKSSKSNLKILLTMFTIGISIMIYIIYNLPRLSE
jgi:hypothetical protein